SPVHLADYRGTASSKRATLAGRVSGGMDHLDYRPVHATAASRYRFVADAAGDYPVLSDLLPVFHSGVQPVNDAPFLANSPVELEERMRAYCDPDLPWDDLVA